MKARRGFFLGLAALGSGFLATARAAPGWEAAVNMEVGSGVNIDILSPFAMAPQSGFMPLQIRISNHSGGARAYHFQVSSRGAQMMNGSQMAAFEDVRVENDTESRTEMLLPVLPMEAGGSAYRYATIEVSGYGVQSPQIRTPADYDPRNRPATGFVSMSEKLSARSWSSLEKNLSDQGKTLKGSQTDLTLLPPDWRALAGVQCLWLTPEDHAGLDAGRQTAIKDWVSRGGVLYLCESTPDQSTRAEFGWRDPAGSSVPVGFGEVRWFHLEGDQESFANQAASEIARLQNWQRDALEPAEGWPVAKTIGALRLNAPFLLSFIGLFAVLVGPVNLFYLAKADRRHRLFWTTPAISLGASLLLIGVIALQDGFGGNGSRVLLTYLLPAQNKAVTVQEQVSRTGVLFSRGFATADDVSLAPVTFRDANNRQFERTDKTYGGDWFASRSLQAQRIESIQQTRSRVQLLNAGQAGAGAPPVVVSSLPVELEELLYLDEAGHSWRGENVRTGQPQTLQPVAAAAAAHRGFMTLPVGSSYLNGLALRTMPRAGPFFYASAKAGPFVDTLPSIRWTNDHAVFLGPVTTDR